MTRFKDDQLYPTTAPELEIIATRGTLAVWRHEGRGPPYIRFGNKVLYEGHVLNAWLAEHRVQPVAA